MAILSVSNLLCVIASFRLLTGIGQIADVNFWAALNFKSTRNCCIIKNKKQMYYSAGKFSAMIWHSKKLVYIGVIVHVMSTMMRSQSYLELFFMQTVTISAWNVADNIPSALKITFSIHCMLKDICFMMKIVLMTTVIKILVLNGICIKH